MDRVFAYLDFLGFKEFMSLNKLGAINIIQHSQMLIYVKGTEDQIHPVSSYDKELQSLAEKRSIDTFEYYLPFSDSVFIVGKELREIAFLRQLGTFVLETFLITAHAYREKADPTLVEVSSLVQHSDGKVEKVCSQEHWFPALFRGGVAFGDVTALNLMSIVSGEVKQMPCLTGKAVIDAVLLESANSAPGFIVHNNVIEKIPNLEFKARFFQKASDHYEFLWPALHYLEENSPDGEINKFNELFRPTAVLWKHYCHLKHSEKYFNMMRLIIRSTRSFFNGKLSDQRIGDVISHSIKSCDMEMKKEQLLSS